MRAKIVLILLLSILAPVSRLSSQQPTAATPPQVVNFETQVQPILTARCYGCHSASSTEADLQLDEKALALKGGESGPAILPGNSKDSLLIHRVMGLDGKKQMPGSGAPLSSNEIETLRRWIDEGANWPDAAVAGNLGLKHWAYQKPVRPPLPVVQRTAWVRNAIDSFVLARLEKEGLSPSPEASRETLIRRLSLDLIGLPPSPAEVDAFLNDARPDAYERVVDRLLASAHYGERWATPWLDLARYGDSDGYEKDSQRVSWPYRDWVIDAFNENKPFDQFTIEQLAGDLLPNPTNKQKIATGFVRASMLNTEAGTDPEEQNWVAQLDRAGTVGTAFLGSTIACAQCHDHKYDPFLQKDFYSLVAFFNNAAFGGGSNNRGQPNFREPTLDLATPEQSAKRTELNNQIRQLQEQMNNWPKANELQAAWTRGILDAEKEWSPLFPTRLESSNGATLKASDDGSILASGPTPDSDTYIVEARIPITGEITAIRIEALPDPSLPMLGPGRDYYGNFSVTKVDVEVGAVPDKLSTILLGGTLTDAPSVQTNDTVIRVNLRQLWRAQVGGGERLRRQLLLLPEKPVGVSADNIIRIRILQASDIAGQILGRFRLSVTTSSNPGQIVDIPHDMRPLLTNAAPQRDPGPEVAAEEEPTTPRGPALSPQQRLTRQWQAIAPELAALRNEVAELQKQITALKIPSTPVLSENLAIAHPATNLRIRGDFTNKGEEVPANPPSFLGAVPAGAPPNRLGLANWLTSRDNPLTARVRVNQIWQSYFGRGIVETSEDFGLQGSAPSHQELLDWLAVEFVEKGWDQKAMHRLIVTSNTYRQSSALTTQLQERDSSNILLGRGPRFRMEAELVRDVVLEASGLLSHKMSGPPVMPYQPDGLWVFPFQPASDQWVESKGEDRYRRGIYTFIRRTARYPSLMVFDAPSRETSVARRPNTDTPLQALTTLNDPAFFEAARAMAQRILREAGANTTDRATYGFRLVTSRTPNATELKPLVSAFEAEATFFRNNMDKAKAVSGQPNPDLAAWTMIANALLNLDETLTKE